MPLLSDRMCFCDLLLQFLLALTIHMFSVFSLSLVYVLEHKKELRTASNIVAYPLT